MKLQEYKVIRFKKDLRVRDNQAIFYAIQQKIPIIGLYCFEPSIMEQADWSDFHTQFIQESLRDLYHNLQTINIPLLIFQTEVEEALDIISRFVHIKEIIAHQETGNRKTFQRDREIIHYAKANNIILTEFPTNGVVRCLQSRDDWQWIRQQRMNAEQCIVQKNNMQVNIADGLQKYNTIHTVVRKFSYLQKWWEKRAHTRLNDFIDKEFENYLFYVGRPYESAFSCSRLSPYITYGNLSIKQIIQATKNKRDKLMILKNSQQKWSDDEKKYRSLIKSLDAFTSRLYRHCHFIQKLESETAYEFKNIHPFYDTIRNNENTEFLERREKWQTWFPLIDAAMKCLQQTWRINFRLRATLVSFICNTCMQDWKKPAHILARLFVDYEPWIHYAQFQMQAWTTWINTYRIYNPTKQLLEKDPKGKFIDKRLPQLESLPIHLKAEPRKVQASLFTNEFWLKLGIDYPEPMINLEDANRKAKKVLRDIKQRPWFHLKAQEIYMRHGSRKKDKKTT